LCCVAVGEQVSEEEESGVDEDFDQTAPENVKLDRRKKKKEAKQTKTLVPKLV